MNTSKKKKAFLQTIGLVTVLLLPACGSQGNTATATPPTPNQPSPTTQEKPTDNGNKIDPQTMSHWHTVSQSLTTNGIIVGAHTGLYTSKNSVDWYKAATGLEGMDVMGIVQSINQPEKLIAGGHGFLKVSNDKGATWSDLTTGLPSEPDVHDLLAIDKDAKNLIAYVAMDGFYLSNDGGKNWNKKTNYPANVQNMSLNPLSNTLYIVEEKGLFASKVDSWQWSKVNSKDGSQVLGLVHDKNGTAYLATSTGLWRTDNFKDFTNINNGKIPNQVVMLGISPKDLTTVIAITNHAQFYLSPDKGQTWKQIK
ncbi:YCF48-related protein [Aneurinibacillus terranovensis]|uniref:YCF48-related protein n=1 Tax=Aneurinibacillus terranovensis TaxID=278991 RepID=UPI0004078FC2|nr:YCF48-related protein [Aneurinibacillus terranovensis]